nr:dihydrodipicolinate synthase family protein [uncultured Draconibacterium sp.]
MKLPLRGIIPPLVTPLLNETELDETGLKNILEYIISGNVHGVFLLGTTGEAPNLSYELRKEFIEKACSFVNKRIPVYVGITDTSLSGSLEIAETAKKAGADALVISSPYYVPMTQAEFVVYLETLVPQLPLPFMMYNMPSCTKLHMSVETVRKSRELGAIGIKDSSGDLGYLYALIEEFKDTPDFAIIVGTELFIPETIINGGHGAVPGGANLFPRLFVDLYEASLINDQQKIQELREKLMQIETMIYDVGDHNSKYFKSIKSAFSVMGICSDYVAMPFKKFDSEQKQIIAQNLKEMDILETKSI